MPIRRIVKGVARRIIRRMRGFDLLLQAKGEVLNGYKADPELQRTAKAQALAEMKARPELATEAAREAILETALRSRRESDLAALNDAAGFVEAYDYTEADLAANRAIMEVFGRQSEFAPESINWFIPHFDHIFRGGIRTIVSFADYFRREKGVTNRLIVYGRRGLDSAAYHAETVKAFPDFPAEDVIAYTGDNPEELPEASACVATLWTSAYHVMKFRGTQAKFYMVQDCEPLFYPAGTVYGLIEATYRFGFWGIGNTPGVAEAYYAVSKAPTEAFVPGIDRSIYSPLSVEARNAKPASPKQVVFYGRPNNRRNCFELGVRALKRLKEKLGEGVRIVSVGGAWEPKEFGVEGAIENLGLLGSLEELAELYRSSDAGLCFMQTKHPSYQPLEYMACGCPTVTNKNPANTWLLKDGENCVLCEPTVSAVTEALEGVLGNKEKSERIIAAGLETVKDLNWPEQMERIFDFICKKRPAGWGKASEGGA